MNAVLLLGSVLGLSLTSGINLYATVFVTGLAVRLGWLELPAPLAALSVLAHPAVLSVSGVLYVVEFLADKVPAVDHAWDVVHAFVRPAGAAVLAWAAIGGTEMDPLAGVLVVLVAGGVAFSSHAVKSGTRLGVGAAGGHATGAGVALSLIEDALAAVGVWLAISHPVVMLVLVVLFLLFFGLFAAILFRVLRAQFRWVRYFARHRLLDPRRGPYRAAEIPEGLARAMREAPGGGDLGAAAMFPAVARGLPGIPRAAAGWAAVSEAGLTFACRSWFRARCARVSWREAEPVLVRRLRGWAIHADPARGRRIRVTFFPLSRPMQEELAARMPARIAAGAGTPVPAGA